MTACSDRVEMATFKHIDGQMKLVEGFPPEFELLELDVP
jgi:hypothetical protein